MNPDTYTFTGDAVTFLGLVGIISAFIIIVTAFRRFFNSPYNFRMPVVKVAQDSPDGHESVVYYESSKEHNQ